ncbi:MAG: T9SS C-terminal target domain-containing protein [Cryomorphaceae bacterium]|nr:MAG: T9SS C-terminal target domain-containing protein [Cryomorphaceae bacterium]
MTYKLLPAIVALALALSGQAQITLTHEFSASDMLSNLEFTLMYIDDDEPVYVTSGISNDVLTVRMFDMDFEHIEDLTFQLLSSIPGGVLPVHYITRTLFDCDPDNIEILISYPYVPLSGTLGVQVLREDGTELLYVPDAIANTVTPLHGHVVTSSVKCTPTGTKLFLHMSAEGIGDDGVKVYDLCGDLPVVSCNGAEGGITTYTPVVMGGSSAAVMPNPTNGFVWIDFNEPIPGNGLQLQVFGNAGQLVKSESVPAGETRVQVDLSAQPSGTYIYRLTGDTGLWKTGKVVKR